MENPRQVNTYEIIGEQVVRMTAMTQTIERQNELIKQQDAKLKDLEAQVEELTRPKE